MLDHLFETERLYVRQFSTGDVDTFAALCADPRVMRDVIDGTILPRGVVQRWITICHLKYAQRGYGTSAVFEKGTNQFIGYCGVERARRYGFDELMHGSHVAAWGKGYATEAGRAMIAYVFQHSRLGRIYAQIYPTQQAAIKVVEKLGFQFVRQTIDDVGAPVACYVIERAG